MSQLTILKSVLENPPVSDELLQYYLDNAGEIICDLRNSDIVESKYFNVQIAIAVELFNKRGAEGEVSHGENGISRGYEKSDIYTEFDFQE